ncbi:MAG: mechanosensitive ion channel family protein [Gammaproteobacteria bacterium]|nr:MAG: mechanosensitive ion channel family protein [Gammaproteobacteria bacterium]
MAHNDAVEPPSSLRLAGRDQPWSANMPGVLPVIRRHALAVAALLGLLCGAPTLAAGVEPDGVDEDGGLATALVLIDGHALLRVRGIAGFPAQQRARKIEQRITDFARDRSLPADAVTLQDNVRGTAIVAGGVTLVTISDGDAALEELGRLALAQATGEMITESVTRWRAERSPEQRLRNVGWAATATAVLAAFLWLLWSVSRRLQRYLETRVAAQVKSVGVQSFEFVKARHLQALIQTAPRLVFWAAVAVTIYVYLDFVLTLFPLTRPLGERLLGLVTDPLATLGLALLSELPNLAFLAVLALVVRYVLKLTRLYFEAIERGVVRFQHFDPEWATPTYKVVRIFLVAFAVVVAYPYIPGSESAAFKGVTVMLGVLFSLGSSSVIANIIAGYTMTYRRAFRRGDRIMVGEVTGDVVDSRVLVTTLRTPKNELVVVPNSEILNKSIVNYSALAREQGLILHTTVGIGYETPWRQVEAMLLMAAVRTPGLKRDPAPFVLQKSLGDFCVVYEINAYTDDAQGIAGQYSALHASILDVFNEYGVQIMTPAYEGDTPSPKIVRPEDWYAAPAQSPRAAPEGNEDANPSD